MPNAQKAPKAQASLDYLIVLMAGFSCLALLFPLFSSTFDSMISGIDVLQAKNLLSLMDSTASELGVFGSGSSKIVSIKPLNKWKLTTDCNYVEVQLGSDEIVSGNFDFCFEKKEFLLEDETVFVFSKSAGKILVNKKPLK